MKKFVFYKSAFGTFSVTKLGSDGKLGNSIACFISEKDAKNFAKFKEFFDLEEIK